MGSNSKVSPSLLIPTLTPYYIGLSNILYKDTQNKWKNQDICMQPLDLAHMLKCVLCKTHSKYFKTFLQSVPTVYIFSKEG
jgi:hypothetical protein